jgi:hypothetical protein
VNFNGKKEGKEEEIIQLSTWNRARGIGACAHPFYNSFQTSSS